MLGRSLCALGRYDEAEPLAEQGRELGHEHDLLTQTLWRQVQALVSPTRAPCRRRTACPRGGRDHRPDRLAQLPGRRALRPRRGLAAAGRGDEAADALEQALERYERKKNLAMVAQVKPTLDALRQTMPT